MLHFIYQASIFFQVAGLFCGRLQQRGRLLLLLRRIHGMGWLHQDPQDAEAREPNADAELPTRRTRRTPRCTSDAGPVCGLRVPEVSGVGRRQRRTGEEQRRTANCEDQASQSTECARHAGESTPLSAIGGVGPLFKHL